MPVDARRDLAPCGCARTRLRRAAVGEQVVHQRFQPLRFFNRRLEQIACGLIDPLARKLHVALDGAQRVADLVRQHRGHLADVRQVLHFQLTLAQTRRPAHSPQRIDRQQHQHQPAHRSHDHVVPRVHYQEVRRRRVEVDAGNTQLGAGMKRDVGAEDVAALLPHGFGAKQLPAVPKRREGRRIVAGSARYDAQVNQIRLVLAQRFDQRFARSCVAQVLQTRRQQSHTMPQVNGALFIDFAKRAEGTEQQYQRKRGDRQRQDHARSDL